MIEVRVSNEIECVCPQFVGAAVEAHVVNTPYCQPLWDKMTLQTTHLLVLINGYDGNGERVAENARFIQTLIRKYCQSDGGSVTIYYI